jgi:hypothetical protein
LFASLIVAYPFARHLRIESNLFILITYKLGIIIAFYPIEYLRIYTALDLEQYAELFFGIVEPL